MYGIYNFVTGPLAWIAFIIFIGGSIYRLVQMFRLINEKENFIYSYMSFKYSFRSILHWITPFGTKNMRLHPVMTIVTFAFHICLVITPIFLMAHIIMWDEAFNISWWALSGWIANICTLIVIAACIFFLIRRITQKEVNYVTDASDYILLAIVAAPFITGFLAYHQFFLYPNMLIFHIITGEIMLAAIPFTRLSHMLLSPLTRAYMGSEFGGVRNAKDW